MLKYIILVLMLLNLMPTFAYITSTSTSPYFNRYPSLSSRSNFSTNGVPTSTYLNGRPYNNRNYRNSHKIYSYNRPRYYKRTPYSYNNYGIPINSLNALEKYALKKNYSRDNSITRLERLEDLAFGAVQTGDIATRYRNVENAILTRPQNNYRRSVIGNIANFFNGQMTGFTPSISGMDFDDNFFNNPYTSGYSNTRAEQYSNGIFGGGWGIMNQNYGGGSSVKILD